MITISQSVGRGGRAKNGNDVRKVQKLLNEANAQPKLAQDGKVGPATIRAIERFQRERMLNMKVDGRVDPGGKTIRRLMETADIIIPLTLEFPSWNSGKLIFSKLDGPTIGFGSGNIRSFVLRDGFINTQTFGALQSWMKKTAEGDNTQLVCTVIENKAGLRRKLDFVGLIAISMSVSAGGNGLVGIKQLKLGFARYFVSSNFH